ncbi:hypothetical protein GCM10023232_06890 [Sphingosinicella ginsenosidimutans]|uniref:response regulator transcription factor n=1 Tax=Allosphingosinicella ginsenosidimutans TaxID=1176539 RepID=UPI00131567E9|nr:LuxR C-terminal-related transcriptional regulator [Sphingosinicella ginsenosidimutans]
MLCPEGAAAAARYGFGILAPWEARLVELAAQSLNNSEIAARNGYAPSTVKSAISRIYRKLGVANRAELITLARQGPRRLIAARHPARESFQWFDAVI